MTFLEHLIFFLANKRMNASLNIHSYRQKFLNLENKVRSSWGGSQKKFSAISLGCFVGVLAENTVYTDAIKSQHYLKPVFHVCSVDPAPTRRGNAPTGAACIRKGGT